MPKWEEPHYLPSFSAWGEDRIIKSWLDIKGIAPQEVRYLDIGAAYPVFLSNTYLHYKNGGSGVLVEPDPKQVNYLREVRPRDIVMDVGVAAERGRGKLLQLTSPVFNTFSSVAAEKAVEQSKGWKPYQRQDVIGEVEVELLTLNQILTEHFSVSPLHVLSIDVEGMDFSVLQSLDFDRFQPLVLCTEIGSDRDAYEDLLSKYGYQLVCWTPDNYIFVRV